MAPPSPKSRCGRKRKVGENSRGLPEPARKRGRAPAAIEAGPTSSHVGVGPSFSGAHVTVPATTISLPLSPSHCSSLLPEPSSLLHAPAISASLQLPATSYGSLQSNRCPKQSSTYATDVYHFCQAAASRDKPAVLPSPSDDPNLSKKPDCEWLSCKLCTCVTNFILYNYF